ncbi:MAG: amidohydrolase family protein [Deltaproteobacteria bacterium]|nr:amidohydrolase family protein [Deltaproteobacteria bacterium]
MKGLWCAPLLLLAAPAWAADLALVGGDVYPVSGAMIPGGTVLIRGEVIEKIGKNVPLPAGIKTIDVRGKRVTPGLFDADSQIGLIEIDLEKSGVDAVAQTPDPIRAALSAADAIDLRSSLVGVARRQGVTTVLSLPAGGLVAGQGALLDLVEERSPLLRTAIHPKVALVVQLGGEGAQAVEQTRAAAVLRFRELLDDARAYQRNKAAFLKAQLYPLSASRLDLEALGEALAGRQTVIFKVSRAADIELALDLAQQEKLKVVLLGAEEGWKVADRIAAAKVPVILDGLLNVPASLEARGARSDNAALLARAGVKVAISARSSHNTGTLRFHLGNAVRAGLPAELALRAATQVPAEIFGQGQKYGTLDPKKVANVVVWSGDPFEPASYAEQVIIRGEVQPTDSRQTKLARRHLQRLFLMRSK